MNFIEFIGKPINDIKQLQDKYYLEYDFAGWFDINGWQEGLLVRSCKDDFDMFLSSNKVIQVIFLYPFNEQFNFMNFTTQTTREEVAFMMGKPYESGQRKVYDNVSKADVLVHYDRYETLGIVVHLEFDTWWDSSLLNIFILDKKLAPYF